MPDISVGVAETGDDEAALRALSSWLREDEALGGAVRGRTAARARREPGAMGGGTLDVLEFAVSSGLGLGGLVLSVLQWRAALRRPAATVLRRGAVEVRLEGRLAADQETVRNILEQLRDGQGNADAGEGDAGPR
ncbi:hypothetical protein [Streptomyces sp. NRRL S-87]|uniref:effector-associated constant component EACC1 n=1 Tax=Streptomyces sp. NRRL S-87 TaxID=1463920 RepID=UPI0004BEF0EC|nr:hypothetical protein [Streptomyces sp. NRRL S-87]